RRAAHAAPGQRVLDMATGTGEWALMAADAVGARGTIWASTSRCRCCAARWPRLGRAVISQLGLMFFPSPVAGAREARRVLRPGGRFAALVWGALEQMPWFGGLAEELLAQFPARREDLFRGVSLGAPGRLESVLAEAGLRGVSVTTDTQIFRFASFEAEAEPEPYHRRLLAPRWSRARSGSERCCASCRPTPSARSAAASGRAWPPSPRAMDWRSPRSRSSAADPRDGSARRKRLALGLAR